MSDHNTALNKDRLESLKYTKKIPEKPLNDCIDILMESKNNYKIVLVQKNARIIQNQNHLEDNVVGFVDGFVENCVYVSGESIKFENIRMVKNV